jgi:hypothetical protein
VRERERERESERERERERALSTEKNTDTENVGARTSATGGWWWGSSFWLRAHILCELRNQPLRRALARLRLLP